MTASIFPVCSIDRRHVRWENFLRRLTPVEQRGELQFKREDTFAPMGLGGINGMKLRQLVYLVDSYLRKRNTNGNLHDKQRDEDAELVSAASVISPQLPMAAAVARHYGIPATCWIGGTTPATAIAHPMISLAAWYGARFVCAPVGWNSVLQKQAAETSASQNPARFFLEYGITRHHDEHAPEDVRDFHEVGARQAANIPQDVTDLILPTGSANSATSVLMGIARHPPKALERIWMIGIGPSKLAHINRRLQIFQQLEPETNYRVYDAAHGEGGRIGDEYEALHGGSRYAISYDDLHGTGRITYGRKQPASYQGIRFHPTYEGKVWRYINEDRPELLRRTTLFWIVGGPAATDEHDLTLCKHLGPAPTKLRLADGSRAAGATR